MAGSEEGTVKRTSSRLNKGISKYDRAKAALQRQDVLEESEMSESAAAAAERPKKKKKGPKKQEPKPISTKKTAPKTIVSTSTEDIAASTTKQPRKYLRTKAAKVSAASVLEKVPAPSVQEKALEKHNSVARARKEKKVATEAEETIDSLLDATEEDQVAKKKKKKRVVKEHGSTDDARRSDWLKANDPIYLFKDSYPPIPMLEGAKRSDSDHSIFSYAPPILTKTGKPVRNRQNNILHYPYKNRSISEVEGDRHGLKIGIYPIESNYFELLIGTKDSYFGPNSDFIVEFLRKMTKCLYSNPVNANGQPDDGTVNKVVRGIMATQLNLEYQSPSTEHVRSMNRNLLNNVLSLATLAITLNVFDLKSKLPKTIFHVSEHNEGWEAVFMGQYDTKGKDLIRFGIENLSLPFVPQVIFYLGLKRAYSSNFNVLDLVVLDGVDTKDADAFPAQRNATPNTVFQRVTNVNNKIICGIFDDYPLFHINGRKGMFVHEFLFIWPFIFGWAMNRKHKTGSTPVDYESLFRGTAKKTLRALMKSLDIKGMDEGGCIPLNMHGNNIFPEFTQEAVDEVKK